MTEDPDDASPKVSAETRSAWKVAAVGVAGAIGGSLIGVWGGVLATDRQLEAEEDKVALENRAEAYEEFIAAVDEVQTELGIATNFEFGTVAQQPRGPLTPAEARPLFKSLIDLQYVLTKPQSKVRVYGSEEASLASGAVRTAVTEAIVSAVTVKVTPASLPEDLEKRRDEFFDNLRELDMVETAFIKVARDELS